MPSRFSRFAKPIVFACFVLLVCQLVLGWTLGYQLDVESWPVNAAIMLLMGISLPIVIWMTLNFIRWSWIRIPLRVLLILTLPLYFLAVAAPTVRIASWETVAELKTDQARYRAYRRPFYLYDSAIELRREVPLVLGLMLVSGPRRAPEADRAELKLRPDGKVEALVHNYYGKEWTYVFPR